MAKVGCYKKATSHIGQSERSWFTRQETFEGIGRNGQPGNIGVRAFLFIWLSEVVTEIKIIKIFRLHGINSFKIPKYLEPGRSITLTGYEFHPYHPFSLRFDNVRILE
jgi:hypothetical protein